MCVIGRISVENKMAWWHNG